MAAVGANAPIISLIINTFIGISLGTNVVIANAVGSRDSATVSKAAHTSVLIAFLGGFVITAIGELLAEPIISSQNVPEDVLPSAVLYFRIYMGGVPVILLYNFESAVFRGVGNTKTPLVILMASGALNVVFNLFFVIVLHMTVDGVALATVLSNAISAGLLLFKLFRADNDTRLSRRKAGADEDTSHRRSCGASVGGVLLCEHTYPEGYQQPWQDSYGGLQRCHQSRSLRLQQLQQLRAGVYHLRGAELRCRQV